jgi:leucyl-tRNA synthetase
MVTKDGAAMSKSRGNVVDPDDMLREYGADALRLFILFASPPEKEFAWAKEGIEGCFRFLNRVWLVVEENKDVFMEESRLWSAPAGQAGEASMLLQKRIHQTIRKVGEDIEKRFHLNTAISSVMELYNLIRRVKDTLKQNQEGREILRLALESLIILLSPFTPHLCEELWERTGHKELLARFPWPAYDPELAKEEKVTVIVQVNGKLRDKFEAEAGISEEDMRLRALQLERIRALVAGREVKKVICVDNKLVNIVV